MVKKNKISTLRKKEVKNSSKKSLKINPKNIPTLHLNTDTDIAMDFAVKTYKRFDKIVKSIILFGSSMKHNSKPTSDIDIIIVVDDVSVKWDQELIGWYRGELDKILTSNPYQKMIHINTVRLSSWWEDLMKGDPVIINTLRYGEAMVDVGGFFSPLKYLLLQGKIKPTPETIYSCLQRAPAHLARSKAAELSAIEGLYWAMVDSAHAALISAKVMPPSPEHIPVELKNTFVNTEKLKMKYVVWYRDLLFLYKKISHGEIKNLEGKEIDVWQERTSEFIEVMARLVKETVEN
jgi:predicted nucleotidyltransferase